MADFLFILKRTQIKNLNIIHTFLFIFNSQSTNYIKLVIIITKLEDNFNF